ncbi:MAG: Crp/Fnr family transcriptional regulator [Betaproteobacteria bacterium]|nr:MAG: Crp/Fnr family transcriptional regulator [Betaproteobacteria bacterium]
MGRPAIQNELLAAMSRKTYDALAPALTPVTLVFGEVLYEAHAPMAHVYFPCESMVSLLLPVENHIDIEVGLVGREGMLGASLALGIVRSPVKALVQGAGSALRLSAARFGRELSQNPALQRAVNRYLHSLMQQITQTAACNRFHVVEARLARWLLMTRDRMRSPKFRMTHEFLSHMLGVRRVGVTEAASSLQRQKLIEYTRGNISILDEPGLEAACCGCYGLVKSIALPVLS